MRTAHARRLAPALTAILLLGLLGVRVAEVSPSAGVVEYMGRSKAEINAIPFRIGRFIGVNTPVTPGAIDLLRPNEILQRTYTDPETGESFSLVFVHCELAKDMTGHYPPNCYPRAGWVEANEPTTVSVEVGDLIIPATLYRFRLDQGIMERTTEILSFFVVPVGPQRFGPDIRLVDLASRTPSASLLGAAQIQVLTPLGMDQAQRKAIWNAVLDAIYPALSEIAEGVS